MELEFDKEIDALMRGGLAGQIKSGETLTAHLDADEISAFAENAMPEKTRALHMAHLADCERCRRILSNLIVLNADAGPETAAVAAPATQEAATPWYRRLLLFPNLAYVMGGLVLVFGGLLSLTLLQNFGGGDATLSRSTEMPATARGPMAPSEPNYSASNSMSNAAASNAANTNSAVAPGIAPSDAATNSAAVGTALAPTTATATEEKMETKDVAGISIDGESSSDKVAEAAPAAAPPSAKPLSIEQPKDADLARARKEEDRLAEAEKSDAATVTTDDAKKRSVKSKQANETQLRSQAGGPMKAKPGPSRDSQQNFPNRADNTFEMPMTRSVGGKTFNLRSGAWYDTAFRGQPTINIRRGSDEYRKLDGGLRSIAESIGGTVVVVWGSKAYRIQ
jgi:hypothetical protein